jgi:SAM-dependent methyltransferase
MTDYRENLNRHYGQDDLCGQIRWECEKLGLTRDNIMRADLANLDEIHIRGQAATLELGCLAGLTPGQRVLDIGCGLGGPARTVAAEFGCRVTGLEIVSEFCQAGAMLNDWVGLTGQVDILEADMRDMPFAAEEFDQAMSLHTLMNVEDKAGLLAEIHRVLKPTGGLLVYEVCGGDDSDLHYPVPWAGGPEISFMVTEADLKDQILAAGFTAKHWGDVTGKALDWFDGLAAGMSSLAPRKAGPNLGVVLGPDAPEKSRNLQRNLREGRIQVVQGYFTT